MVSVEAGCPRMNGHPTQAQAAGAGVNGPVVDTQAAGNGPHPVLWGLVTVVVAAVAVGLAMVSMGVL